MLLFFFFNDTATTEIYTLSLHDALPISAATRNACSSGTNLARITTPRIQAPAASRACSRDRKSTRLNSSHTVISYAVFCLKKKKNYPEMQSTEQKIEKKKKSIGRNQRES